MAADPFVAAMLRVAQQHYGGNLGAGGGANWLRRISQSPEARSASARRVIALLGSGDRNSILALRPDALGLDSSL